MAKTFTNLPQFKFQTTANFIMMLATRLGNKNKCSSSQSKVKLTTMHAKDHGVIAQKKAKLGWDGKENKAEMEDDLSIDSIALMTDNNSFAILQNFDPDDDDGMDTMMAETKHTNSTSKDEDSQDKTEKLVDSDDDDTFIEGIWEDAETQKIVKQICHETKEAEKAKQATNTKTYADLIGKYKEDDDFLMSEEEAQVQAVKDAMAVKQHVAWLSKSHKTKKKTGRVLISGTIDTCIYDTKEESIRCINDSYTMMIVEPPKSKAAEHIEMTVAMVKHIYKLILTVDEHVVIYMYDDTSKDKITSDKVIVGLEKFPTNLTILKKFFYGLQIGNNGKMFLNLCIAMDNDAAELIKTTHSLLQSALDQDIPELCNANWYNKHLQVPFSEDAGWIMGLFYNCNAEHQRGAYSQKWPFCLGQDDPKYFWEIFPQFG